MSLKKILLFVAIFIVIAGVVIGSIIHSRNSVTAVATGKAVQQELIATVSGTGVHGWLWLEFILALALLVYIAARAAWDRLPFNLPIAHERLLVVGTAVQLLLIVGGFFAMPPTNGVQGLSISWDFGAFLALIASIVAAAPVIYPVVKSYLDSRKAASGAQRY